MVAKKNQSSQVLLHFAIKCPELFPCTLQSKKSSLYPEQGKLMFLSLEHMLQKASLWEVNACSRKEQLAGLTSQGSVYILSPPITV